MNNLTTYHPTDCDAAATYNAQCCPNFENGGIRHIALVEENYRRQVLMPALIAAGEDPNANAAAWFAGLQANKVIAIRNTRGSMGEPAAITSPGYGGAADVTTGFDFTATIHDINLINNVDFLNRITRLKGWVLYFATSGVIWDSNFSFSADGKFQVEEDINSQIPSMLSFRWKGAEMPQHYYLPNDVFNCEDFDMAVLFTDGSASIANFLAEFESPATDTGAITLVSVTQTVGSVVTNETSNYSLAAASIAVSDTDKALAVTITTPQTAGLFTYTFELSGGGRSTPQIVQATQVV